MCITCSNAQEINYSHNNFTKDYKKNSIFFETKSILVFSGFWGLGYERLFPIKENLKITTELSFSIIPFEEYFSVTIPHINLLFGNEQHFELGGGFGFDLDYKNMMNYNVTYYTLTFRVGYRYQRKEGGFFFRTGLVPWMWINARYGSYDFFLFGNLAFGYSF